MAMSNFRFACEAKCTQASEYTGVEWREKRWEASVRVLKRARREWDETVAQIVQSLERTFDPGASQGTYKRAAVDRSVKKHQTTDDRTHA
jgi:hypothetical protein